jgi:hypothetical protein
MSASMKDMSLGLLFGAAVVIIMIQSFKPLYEASGAPYNYTTFSNFDYTVSNITDMGSSTYAIYKNLSVTQSALGSVFLWTNLLISGPLTALKIVFIQLPNTAIATFVDIISAFKLGGPVGENASFLIGLVGTAAFLMIVFKGWQIFFGGEG